MWAVPGFATAWPVGVLPQQLNAVTIADYLHLMGLSGPMANGQLTGQQLQQGQQQQHRQTQQHRLPYRRGSSGNLSHPSYGQSTSAVLCLYLSEHWYRLKVVQ